MKGITYCGACADYDLKKHRCKRGAMQESNPQDKFFDDCPLPNVAPVVWTPVTDRLPEVDTNSKGYKEVTVIATNGKFVRPLIYERAIIRGKVVRRWKWLWDRIYDGNPVTHWMPLPEPPKMEGGTKNAAN